MLIKPGTREVKIILKGLWRKYLNPRTVNEDRIKLHKKGFIICNIKLL
jgi:hypothetical protein